MKPFKYTQAHDLDHSHNPPRVGSNLLSLKPIPADHKSKTVIVTIHGFSGTPFESKYILEYLCSFPTILGSSVMMGGHGENVNLFRESSWMDWQKPLEDELDALESLGYTNIVLLGTSTGCTVALELLSRKIYSPIKQLVFIAPIIDSTFKVLRLGKYIHPDWLPVKGVSNTFQEDWYGYWFREMPTKSLAELDHLTRKMKKNLKKGLRLPSDIEVLLIQSRFENIVDPSSSLLLASGLVNNQVELMMLNSKWHLPVLPRMKDTYENKVRDKVFKRIESFIKPSI